MTRYYHSSQNTRRFNSVSHQTIKLIHFTLLALTVIFAASCEKGPTRIGNKLLPGSDFVDIKSIDTLSARSYTIYTDSVLTVNPSVSYLGQIYDPYFGTTTAGFVSQIRLANKWDGKPYTVDSVKLFLQLTDVKGGAADVLHKLKFSEISEQIYTDKPYYSNTTVPLTGYEISDILLPKLKADTINNIEIRLPVSFGEYLIRDTTKLFYSNTKPDFRSYFKGLYFQMIPDTDPLLLTLSVAPTANLGYYNNTMVLYMHGTDDVKKEYYFILDATNRNAAYNKFVHDFSTAAPDKMIRHINDNYRDTMTYLQYLNGVYTRIKIPGLENLKNDPEFANYAVNKARLIVPVYTDNNLYKLSKLPARLRLRYRAKSRSTYEVPDYAIESTYHTFFDGSLDTIARVYKFNIPTFVQEYLKDATGQALPELELFQTAGTKDVKNVILKANNSKTPVIFQFTYTKF